MYSLQIEECQRKCVFATTSNLLIPISLQPNGVNIRDFNVRYFDRTEFLV